MKTPIRTIIVDDHAIMLDGISSLLSINKNIDVVAKYTSGEQMCNHKALNDVDLILLDINMKGMNGIEALGLIKKKGFIGKSIFLTLFDDLEHVTKAVLQGINGYVTKTNTADYLLEAIDSVFLDDKIYYSPDIRNSIIIDFARKKKRMNTSDDNELVDKLSDRELDVLRLITHQLTSEEIARKLFIAKCTVDTHRKNLINKLKVKNAVGLGQFAERHSLF